MDDRYRSFLLEGEAVGSGYALSMPRRLPSGVSGNLFGKGIGSSLEFLDHREYQPGDDIRHINWNALARTEKLIVKLFREEITPHLDLLIDDSASMGLPETQKARSLLGMAALLAKAADNAGFSRRVWLLKKGWELIPNGHLPPKLWEGISLESACEASDSFVMPPPSLKPLGIRIILSDLFWRIDPDLMLRPLVRQASAVLVVQMLSQIDVNPGFSGNIRLHDIESSDNLELVMDEAALRNYEIALARHRQSWKTACDRAGARFCWLIAEKFVETWMPSELVAGQFLSVIGSA